MSNLQIKSETLVQAANHLYKANLHPAVAHSAYYCCVQVMKHIWLHSISKTEDELREEQMLFNKKAYASGEKTLGSHQFLIKNTANFIRNSDCSDAHNNFRTFNNNIWQLRELRNNADYSDNQFNETDSLNSLTLSSKVMLVLKKY